MNAMVVLRVALVLFLVGAIANVDARLDPEAISEAGVVLPTSESKPLDGYTIFNSKPSNSEACCDKCECQWAYTRQCRCTDITESKCHAGCKACMCTRSFPGQCRCLDINKFCHPKCSSIEAH